MFRMMHGWLLSAAVLVLAVHPAFAQTPGELYGASAQPGPISSAWQLFANEPAHASADRTLEDRNDSIWVGAGNNVGWFADVELDLVAPHVHNQLGNPVSVGPTSTRVALPSASLDWSVSPRFEVGYRLGQGAGELLLSYRFLSTSGSTTTPAFDAAGNTGMLHSRLAMNVVDMDYASKEPSLLPWFEMKWRFGIRLANLYFDSEEASPGLQQHVTNYFFGAGPHGALELWRPISDSHFSFFAKLDIAGVLGKVQQGFEETLPGPVSGFTRQTQFMPSTMLDVQLGLGWTPRENWRLSLGYTYEHWWDAAYASGSTGDVWVQGVLFRCEWKY